MSRLEQYDPSKSESKIYSIWEQRGLFEINQGEKAPFAIMMPPPNVTGSLHIGHALTFTLQDIIVRYKRMDGHPTLWQPGTDHAGIATQNVVEKRLLAEGITKEELGREKFLEKVWEWKAYSGGTIVKQMRRLGIGPAWSRERFTMDEGLAASVRKAFVQLYNEKMIVRGDYMVNWCTHDGALSDIEVDHKETKGYLYHLRYPLSDGSGVLVVATTRPETYFGDTAVMVHPEDERYTHLVGQTVRLPIIDREIPIIADEHVDRAFGTGVVKVTPAHDPNDYEVGQRHNLPFITIFDEKGILNRECGEFAGLERLEARSIIIERLKALGYVDKIEEHTHQVGHCYRCGNVVEPYISKQWFVKKELASEAIARVNAGETKFIPASWKNNFDAWMRDLRDWCISRQLWWGHRIPVWYCHHCGHEWASEHEHEHYCPKCHHESIHQDPDVLDTWFSSALWPFSTLGWGNPDHYQVNKDDLARFYPNALLITGFDILFFWVARMLMMGTHFMKAVPFKDVYLHALVRDEHGQKMSKSRGNVIDPLDKIEEYSADALRFALTILAVQGRDIKLSNEKIIQGRNFANKLFNAAKFLQMNAESFADLADIKVVTPLGRYMKSRLALATTQTREHLDGYRFNDAITTIYRFLWDEFCDWGIELSKASKESIGELGAIFKEALKLLHPVMPFITEELYQSLSGRTLGEGESIMTLSYPEDVSRDEAIEQEFGLVIEAIIAIRRAKATINLANKPSEIAYIKGALTINESVTALITKLARVERVEKCEAKIEGCAVDITENLEIYVPMSAEAKAQITSRLLKQVEKLQKEYDKLHGMLSNERFIANAPEAVITQNREALTQVAEQLMRAKAELEALS
ncbi:MAG: valine--tRNA ligase [Campylobacterales bacterium]